MRILGISAFKPHSAAVSLQDNKILGAAKQEIFSGIRGDASYPSSVVSWLKDVHKDYDYVSLADKNDYKRFKECLGKNLSTSKIVAQDYEEALVVGGLTTTPLKSAAVIIVDYKSTALGYYADKQLHILKRFPYPNSLSLFYAAATKFLGYDPVLEQERTIADSRLGKPTYAPLIKDKIVKYNHKDYKIQLNLQRGIGRGVGSLDIASSVQQVYTDIILNLAKWLKQYTSLDNLLFIGNASSNYLVNTELTSVFANVIVPPVESGASAALGAASLISRPLYENAYLGPKTYSNFSTDLVSKQLLDGHLLDLSYGNQAFSYYSLGSKSQLCIPYNELIQKHVDNLDNKHYYVCRDCDYDKYVIPKYVNGNKTQAPLFEYNFSKEINYDIDFANRLFTVNSSSNPILNRLLTLLAAKGFPILLVKDTLKEGVIVHDTN
jgi:predicted NodU family carbamoyl transferase